VSEYSLYEEALTHQGLLCHEKRGSIVLCNNVCYGNVLFYSAFAAICSSPTPDTALFSAVDNNSMHAKKET